LETLEQPRISQRHTLQGPCEISARKLPIRAVWNNAPTHDPVGELATSNLMERLTRVVFKPIPDRTDVSRKPSCHRKHPFLARLARVLESEYPEVVVHISRVLL